MSSIYGPTDRPPEDLTGRARIRDAAMAQFADRGFKDTTIKSIAEAAGVSTGLVQHHFRTKEGLRQACDEAVVEIVRRQLAMVERVDSEVTNPDFASVLYDVSPLLVRYMIWLLVEGSPAAVSLFDEMAAGTEQFLSRSWPDRFPPESQEARDGATLMSVMHLGAAVLHEHVNRRMRASLMDRSSAPRIGLVMLNLYEAMGQWAGSETGVQARAAVATYLASLDEENSDE